MATLRREKIIQVTMNNDKKTKTERKKKRKKQKTKQYQNKNKGEQDLAENNYFVFSLMEMCTLPKELDC